MSDDEQSDDEDMRLLIKKIQVDKYISTSDCETSDDDKSQRSFFLDAQMQPCFHLPSRTQ